MEYSKSPKQDTTKPVRNSRRRRLAIVICVVVVILGALFFTGMSYVTTGYNGSEPVRISFSEGTTPEQMRDLLTSQLGSYGGKVYWLWSVMGHGVPHGSYVVRPDMAAFRAARMIAKGRQTPVRLTFNNLRTFSQLCGRIGAVMECDSASFAAAADSILPGRGYTVAAFPAAFVPDTYEFYWTDSASRIVERLVSVRDDYWNDSRRAKAKSLGLTPVQVATVASIVEEETSKADERPLVARLYLNRLKKKIKLQADPTVKYAIGDFSLRRILGKHLAVESPYNTYKVEGLPPGPIRISDRSAMDAVLDAPEHDYIYMCAREDFSGYHNFATDYATHQANARRYRQALDRRGIR